MLHREPHASGPFYALGLTLPLLTALACSNPASPNSPAVPAGGGGGVANGSAGSAGSAATVAGTSAAQGGSGQAGGSAAAGQPGSGGGTGMAGQATGGAGQAGSAQGGSAAGGSANTGVAPVIAAGVRWFGRVDVSAANAIKFAWSGTGFVGSFTGPVVSAKLSTQGSGDIYFQPVVDGKPGARFPVAGAEKTYELAANLSAGPHEIALYRESEGKGLPYSVFSGFAAGTPGTPPAFSGRLIEVIGDSISAGFGNLGTEQHPNGGQDPSGGCVFETKTESAYQAYAHVAARDVNADASVLAGSGWGIYSDNGGSTQNVMPALFPNTVGEQKTPAWSFAAKPQAVVINLGTNDSSAHNLTADKFKPAYTAFLTTIRSKYPDALILCAVGSMLSGTDRTNAVAYINEMVADLSAKGDKKVKLLDLGTQDALKGTGCAWHPNVAEDARMAGILSAALKDSLGW
ncbi:MAG: GDSL-type esterase/lipase family protein [Myxococcales bacterium]